MFCRLVPLQGYERGNDRMNKTGDDKIRGYPIFLLIIKEDDERGATLENYRERLEKQGTIV